MMLELYIPDQECPNALSADQQDVIERFRRDIIGAQSASVKVKDESGEGWEKIFDCGSVPRAPTPE